MLFVFLAVSVVAVNGQSLRGAHQVQANMSFGFATSGHFALEGVTTANSSDVVLGALAAGPGRRGCAYRMSMATAEQCEDQGQQIPGDWVSDYDGAICTSASSQRCYNHFNYQMSVASLDACAGAAQTESYNYYCYDQSSQLCFMAKDLEAQVLLQNAPCTSDDSNAPAAPQPAPSQPTSEPVDSGCVYVGAAWYKCSASASPPPAEQCQSVGAGWWVCQP